MICAEYEIERSCKLLRLKEYKTKLLEGESQPLPITAALRSMGVSLEEVVEVYPCFEFPLAVAGPD